MVDQLVVGALRAVFVAYITLVLLLSSLERLYARRTYAEVAVVYSVRSMSEPMSRRDDFADNLQASIARFIESIEVRSATRS